MGFMVWLNCRDLVYDELSSTIVCPSVWHILQYLALLTNLGSHMGNWYCLTLTKFIECDPMACRLDISFCHCEKKDH